MCTKLGLHFKQLSVKWLTLHVCIQTISCCHLVAALGYCLWRQAWLWATGVCSCCHFQGCVLEAKRPGAFLWFFALNQYCMHCMLIMFHCSKNSCNLHVTAEGELGTKDITVIFHFSGLVLARKTFIKKIHIMKRVLWSLEYPKVLSLCAYGLEPKVFVIF